MRYRYSSIHLLVALAAPLTVFSQQQDGGHEKRDIAYTTVEVQAAPVIVTVMAGAANPPVVTPLPSSSSTPVAVVVPPPSSSSTPVAAIPAQSSPFVAASSGSGSGSSSGTGSTSNPGTSIKCNGPGMNIGWSSNSLTVPFSWSGGSGTTAPGTCTNLGDFMGQLAVNGTGGTILEGNYNGGSQYFDVSFIIGYSAPMMCWTSTGMSGCSIDLHENARSQNFACPQPGPGGICINPVGSSGNATPGAYKGDAGAHPWCRACSAPHEFFQPCAGSGYTYPYDDGATQVATGTIQCCIGTQCGKTGREGSTKGGHPEPNRSWEPCTLCSGGASKRGLLLDDAGAVQEAKTSKKHRRSSHRHARAHGHAES